MYIKEDYKLQTVAGKSFIFLHREGLVDMTRILSFSKSAVWLWENLEGRSFTEEDSLQLLTEHYEGDREVMKENLRSWLDKLVEEQVIINE